MHGAKRAILNTALYIRSKAQLFMETLLKADVFFFITSISVVVLTIILSVFLYYLISAMRHFKKLAIQVEENLGSASAQVEEMVERVSDSFVFSFLFPKKRKKHVKVVLEK